MIASAVRSASAMQLARATPRKAEPVGNRPARSVSSAGVEPGLVAHKILRHSPRPTLDELLRRLTAQAHRLVELIANAPHQGRLGRG